MGKSDVKSKKRNRIKQIGLSETERNQLWDKCSELQTLLLCEELRSKGNLPDFIAFEPRLATKALRLALKKFPEIDFEKYRDGYLERCDQFIESLRSQKEYASLVRKFYGAGSDDENKSLEIVADVYLDGTGANKERLKIKMPDVNQTRYASELALKTTAKAIFDVGLTKGKEILAKVLRYVKARNRTVINDDYSSFYKKLQSEMAKKTKVSISELSEFYLYGDIKKYKSYFKN